MEERYKIPAAAIPWLPIRIQYGSAEKATARAAANDSATDDSCGLKIASDHCADSAAAAASSFVKAESYSQGRRACRTAEAGGQVAHHDLAATDHAQPSTLLPE